VNRALSTSRFRALGRRPLAFALAAGIVAPLLPAFAAHAAPRHEVLTSSAPDLRAMHAAGGAPLAANRVVQIGLTVSHPNAQGEAALFRALYDPASPQYHQFLTPAQYTARFGVSEAQAHGVRSFLTDGGLKVAFESSAHTTWLATGTAAQVDRLFHTTLRSYHLGATTFYANDSAPSVPLGLGIKDVSLNDAVRLHTASFPLSSNTTPKRLADVYDLPGDNLGQGQQVALFGWGMESTTDSKGKVYGVESDLRQFEAENNLPQVNLRIQHAGAMPTADPTNDANGLVEWDLDAQASTGMAPGISLLTFYFGTDSAVTSGIASLQAWADDPNGAKQGSASWGLCESNPAFAHLGQGYGEDMNAVLEQTTIEGRTLFTSTGDTGSGCAFSVLGAANGVVISPMPMQMMPASSPFAVAVGGTALSTTPGSPAKRDQEISWTHGGGGPSRFQAAPSWQQGVPGITDPCLMDEDNRPYPPGAEPLCRGVPDVAATSGDAASGYKIVNDGATTGVAGTSLSSPLWVGMWSRVNAAAAGVQTVDPSTGQVVTTYPGLGFAAPLIYQQATSDKYSNDFFDVTLGTNGAYHAAAGWDYTTGWGVPDVAHLTADLNEGHTAAVNTAPAVVPPAPPSATVPSGVCWTDKADDAHNVTDLNATSNPAWDLLKGAMSDDGTTLKTLLTFKDLSKTLPTGTTYADYLAIFKLGDTNYFTDAEIGPDGSILYQDGVYDPSAGTLTFNNTDDTGSFTEGPNGVVEVDVALSRVGSPGTGTILTNVSSQIWTANDPVNGLSNVTDTGGPLDLYKVGTGCIPPPPPAPPTDSLASTAPQCPAAFTDPKGDTLLPKSDTADLTTVSYLWDATTGLTVTAHVVALRADTAPPPPGSIGEDYDAYFTIGGEQFYIRAARQLGSAPTFTLRRAGDQAGLGNDSDVGPATGSFDIANNTVTMTIAPNAVPGLTTGASLGGVKATAWQNEGRLLLRVDDAMPAAGCVRTI
jgi:hypothetical protein